MNKFYSFGWYFLVILTIIFLAVSIFHQDMLLAGCSFILAWQLKKTMVKIPLPQIYKQLRAASVFDKYNK